MLVVAACAAGTTENTATTAAPPPTQVSLLPPAPESVEEVVDGRTVLLSNGLRARVLGLAAPGECWSALALKFGRDTLLGKKVRYSRASESAISVRLADNSDYATLAVSQGASRAEKDDPVLTGPEQTAAKAGLGLWGPPCKGQDTTAPPPPPPAPPVVITTPAPPPVVKKGCAVTYRVATVWANGFHTELVVRNDDPAPVTRWTLRWKFPSGQQIRETWGMTARQTGADVVAVSQDGNGSIAAGGQVSLRFNATTSGPNVAPTAFTLNGVTCSLG
jgi:hypothetical protein